ncbi:SAUR-like auxin-responsive protein family [Striga asiatica]|uniref:SAUR-like auxin-responsive protein family n=1 Tax=Striga asiatica TaxID=4170 RepID=A0A5A7P181_STRAF|nr:SAUR-like auxin-responsive protein family [Striga asiatica]
MVRIGGFVLKHRVRTCFRRVFRRGFSPAPCSRLVRWARRFRRAIAGRSVYPGRGYMRVGQDPVLEKLDRAPKGHMAVYVGQKDVDFQRILVPVAYFNHPLFGELLRESENEFGFDQPGGLTIPCRISEFERVQTRIKGGN